ncbi:2Fe-2S iron-sulfur cluster-binding protein [Bdellovibrio reynosensis]|uniref:2Fe-2S iron-sulfur cluster binding domain-containing protein n=1 Tax=Bdellovibrio reynosensis TaxID=2835041 RepID=A0ABY4C861_9BACT|nr:2Fe-2S iron-sulfur cluster binding domain-containing protein [Bdellovibrio reynosensis]UOF00909.1 2Fe-2S iron-sulfur cluster binding domain-containing protein [Bdellovibrio reynosensis]
MKIKFILNKEEYEVEGEEGRSILDIALINKLSPPYSCMDGHCGTCEAKVLQGQTSEDKEGSQTVRTCQAIPSSEYVVIAYDKGPN